MAVRDVDVVVHRRGHPQLALVRAVHEQRARTPRRRAGAARARSPSSPRRADPSTGPGRTRWRRVRTARRPAPRRRPAPNSQCTAMIERWVSDTSRLRAQPDHLPGRRPPLEDAVQHAGAQIEDPLVVQDCAVPDVHRLVVDEHAEDLAVGHVEDGLAVLGEPVPGLRVGQRADLVERVEVGAGQRARVALVEVAADADVPVGQGEQRLAAGEVVEVDADLAQLPGIDGKAVVVASAPQRAAMRTGVADPSPLIGARRARSRRRTPLACRARRRGARRRG